MLEKNKIYLGDCLELMKEIPDNSIDLVLTDPPYNAKNIGPKNRVYKNQVMKLSDSEYSNFCKKWFDECERISKMIVFTPGIANTHNYSQPKWIACWHKPSSVSFNRFGGFNAWEPIFIFGKNVAKLGQDYILQNTFNFSKGLEKDHPCPKPLPLWKKLVLSFSKEGQTILDPFAGSGTTAIACHDLDRDFICIEKEPEYHDIATKRYEQHIAQMRLF